jgi:hypothetical protein
MFKKIIKSVIGKSGYRLVPEFTIQMNVRQMRNFLYYHRLYLLVQGKAGNVVECGVGKGRTLLYFSFLSHQEGKKRKIYGFDSFEGFPEPATEDTSYRAPKKGEWSGISTDDIISTLKTAGLPNDFITSQVTLVKGFFNESLKKYDGSPIAILHVDADLYESYKDVLTALYPKVIPGGVVLFDEYRTKEWPGATQAVDEFFKNRVKDIQHDAGSGKYYIIK